MYTFFYMNICRKKKGKNNGKRGAKKSVEEQEAEEVVKEREILNYLKASRLEGWLSH